MWAQTLAQMKRLRDTGGGIRIRSRTYERFILPRIRKTDRVLDFGAGQMDYVRRLQREGYDIHGLEFYLRQPHSMELDVARVHEHIGELCRDLAARGRYDVVVCDSVINSVTSPRAEAAVLSTVNALTRPGGLIVFSGRCREHIDRLSGRRSQSTRLNREVWFLDRDGITAMYQRGVWLFQKFHTAGQVHELAKRFIGPRYEITDHRSMSGGEFRDSAWAVAGHKQVDLDDETVRDSLAFEFDLPLPDGKRYGRASDIVRAWETSRSTEAQKNDRLFPSFFQE
jgi:ParB family chromosome partitioning protein